MTRTNQKYRALFLSAIMVLSIMVGSVAFAGTAAAEASGTSGGSVSPNTVALGDNTHTLTITADGVDHSSTYTVASVTFNLPSELDIDSGSGTASPSATVTTGTGGVSNVAASLDESANTVTVTWDVTTAGGTGESVTVSVDATAVNATATGTHAITADVDADATAGNNLTAQSVGSVTVDDSGPTIRSAIELTRSTNTIVEVAFDEPVSDTGGLDTTEFDVWVDGESVTPTSVDYLTGASPDGTITLTLANDVLPNQTLMVNATGDVSDGVGNAVTQGNVTAQVSGSTLTLNDGATTLPEVSPYQGTQVAVDFGPNQGGSATDTDVAFERYEDNSVQFSGATGRNSQVVVFDSSGESLTSVHRYFADNTGDSTPDAFAGNITLRDLDLSATADSTSITDASDLTGTVSASAGNRDMEVTLFDSNDDVVAEDTLSTDSSTGEATFNFGQQSAGTYYVEVQDVLSGATATTADVTVEEAGDAQAGFGQNTYSTFSGGIAEISLSLSNTDTATMTLGSTDAGYHVNVTVEDGDGDGSVIVLWNTYQTGDGDTGNYDDELSAQGSDDEVLSTDGNLAPTSPVDTGSYDLDVRQGADETVSAQGVSVVAVEERSTNGMSSWTAPEERDLSSLSDVLSAQDNGNLTASDDVAIGDTLVLALDANGLEGVLASHGGANTTDDFLSAQDNNLNLSIVQENPGQNRAPKNVHVDLGSLNVIEDVGNNTYYLVIDTGAVDVQQGGSGASLADGDQLNATVDVWAESGFQAANDTVSDEFSANTPSISLDRDPVRVLPESGQPVTGTSSLAPGSTLRIQLSSTGDTSPRFIKSTTVTVAEDGSFSGEFDFSEQSVGDTFSVSVRDSGGDSLADSASADGEVAEQIETPTPEPRTVTIFKPSPTPQVVTEVVERTVIEERTVIQERTVTVVRTPGQPGFGIAVAVVALLAAALLAIRRRD